jgi:hypothetical protein
MADLSSLSDDELMRIATGVSEQPVNDLSAMSDEELLKIVGGKPDAPKNDRKAKSGSLPLDWARDAGHVAGDFYEMITNPQQTAEGVWELTKGVASKLLGQSGRDSITDATEQTPEARALMRDINKQKKARDERSVDALIADKTEDYGSLEAAGDTALHRPFTAALDLSTVLAPGRMLPGRAGRALGAASDAINPINAAARAVGRVTRPIGEYARSSARVDRNAVNGNRGLGREFGVDQTRGQISNDPRILAMEDRLRYEGGAGGEAQRVMQAFDDNQLRQLEGAGERVRSGMTGAREALTPSRIGEVISNEYTSARNAARDRVRGLYDRAFDPDALAAAGVASDVPIETVMGLPNQIRTAFMHPDRPGGILVPTPETTPSAMRAMTMLDRFGQSGEIHSAIPGMTAPSMRDPLGGRMTPTGIGWQQMDLMRKMLDGLRRGAASNPTDRAAMRRIMDVFDEQMGRSNPLLNEARAAHMERVRLFDPQRTNAKGSNSVLKDLSNDNNPGQTIYNALFEGAPLKRGEAGPLIQQLQTMFGENAPAMQAIREGMLQRLLVDKRSGQSLSPVKASRAIREALEGPQAEIYAALFPPAELHRLARYGELLEHIGTTRAAQNPSKTSYPLLKYARARDGAGVGAAVGAGVGASVGGPIGGAVGAAVGGGAGGALDNLLAFRRAQRAVSGDYSAPVIYPRVARTMSMIDNGVQAGTPSMGRLGIISGLLDDQEQ